MNPEMQKQPNEDHLTVGGSREDLQTVLLPCPFCGMKPDDDLIDTLYPGGRWREDDGMRHYLLPGDKREGHGRVWTMHCNPNGCGAQTSGDSRAEAIAAWNRRTPSPPPQWQPIETAPENRDILLYWEGRGTARGRYTCDETGEGWKFDADRCVPKKKHQPECTHWMPLPAPPGSTLSEPPRPNEKASIGQEAALRNALVALHGLTDTFHEGRAVADSHKSVGYVDSKLAAAEASITEIQNLLNRGKT